MQMPRSFGLLLAKIVAVSAGVVLIDPLSATDVNFNNLENSVTDAAPGSTICVTDGTYSPSMTIYHNGSPTDPAITVQAAHPGSAVITGPTKLTLGNSGTPIIFKGFLFDSATNVSSNAIVTIAGTNSRLTDCAFVNCGPRGLGAAGPSASIVTVGSTAAFTRVDHNFFKGSLAQSLRYYYSKPANDAGLQQWADHNYFADIQRLATNGQEPLQIGQGPRFLLTSGTDSVPYEALHTGVVVEKNRWENTTADTEVMSNKTSGNVIRYNTFANCYYSAGLSLRDGDDCVIEGNFWLGGGYGIEVHGSNHVVANNHMRDLQSLGMGGFTLPAGTGYASSAIYPVARNNLFAYNTVANLVPNSSDAGPSQEAGFMLGGSFGSTYAADPSGFWRVMPAGNWFYNNIVESGYGTLYDDLASSCTTWESNFGNATGGAVQGASDSGIQAANPLVSLSSDGLYRLNASSLAVGKAHATDGYLTVWVPEDMDGQARSPTDADPGADEISSSPITRSPIAASDVGPSWVGGPASSDFTPAWAPTNLTASSLGAEQVQLSWIDTDGAVAAYRFRFRTEETPWLLSSSTWSGSTDSAVVSGLTPYKVYYFQVRAEHAGGTDSSWSAPVQVATPGTQIWREAESPDGTTAGVSPFGPWAAATEAGSDCMQAPYWVPASNFANWSQGGGMDYQVSLSDGGTYTAWARCLASDNGSDSVRWGINGVEYSDPTYGVQIGPPYNQWEWVYLGSFGVAAPGTITFNLRDREHDACVDQIYLTNSGVPGTDGTDGTFTISPPMITGQPWFGFPTDGGTATLTADATAIPPPTYQWEKVSYASTDGSDGSNVVSTDVAGATDASYTFSSFGTDASAYYAVRVSTPQRSTTSTPVPVQDRLPMAVTVSPAGSETVYAGDPVVLTGSTNMPWNSSYQWAKGDPTDSIPLATSTALTIPYATPADAGWYYLVASDIVATDRASDGVYLTVLPRPVEGSGSMAFEAESYQGTDPGTPPSYNAWTTASSTPGYVGSGYVAASSQPGDTSWAAAPGLDYYLRFSDPGHYTVLARCYGPAPGSDSIRWGINGAERSNATDGSAFGTDGSWTWVTLGTVDVPTDGWTPTLNLRRCSPGAIVDRFYVTTDSTPPAGTDLGPLTSTDGPSILTPPSSSDATVGGAVTLTGIVAGGDSYQWTVNGNVLTDGRLASGAVVSGSSTPQLKITPVPDGPATVAGKPVWGTAGTYRLIARNANGAAISAPAIVVVNGRSGLPPSISAAAGKPVLLAVTPDSWLDYGSGSDGTLYTPVRFQWYVNSTAVPGATGASYFIPAATDCSYRVESIYTSDGSVVASSTAGMLTVH